MPQYKVGDVTGVKTRSGIQDVVIKSIRQVSKGRNAGKFEYELAPIQPDQNGKTYGFRAVGEQFFVPATKKYSSKKTSAATAAHSAAKDRVETGKAELDRTRYNTVDQMDPKPGDVITVRGRQYGNWQAAVAAVNWRTGKLGIMRDPEVIRKLQQRQANVDYINWLVRSQGGEGVNRRRVQKMRWIAPEAVIKLERQGQVIWTEKDGKVAPPPAAPETPPAPMPYEGGVDLNAGEPSKARAMPEPAKQRKVYGPPPGGKAKGNPARVHTRMKGKVYVPANPPSQATAGGKYGMSMKGDKLQVSGDGWTQEWEPFEENRLMLTVGDIRKIVREELGQGEMCQGSWKDADIDRINDEMDAEEDALNYDPSGRWSSGSGAQFNLEREVSSMAEVRQSWNPPLGPNPRWVKAKLFGREFPVWLRSETAEGFWVQLDPEGPFYLVDSVKEMSPVGESVMMTVGNIRNMVKKALNERLKVGDYVIVKQRGMWNAYTLDGEHAAGGTPEYTKDSIIAWAQKASDDNQQYEDDWERENDPDAYYDRL